MFDSLTSFILLVVVLYLLIIKPSKARRFADNETQTNYELNWDDHRIRYTSYSPARQQQAENPFLNRGNSSKRNRNFRH